MTTILLAVLAFFAGHMTAPEKTVTVPVKVPVPVECRVQVPDRPAMPTEQLRASPTLDQFTQASMAELERREGYEQQLRAALQACTDPVE